jgi:hypothetical protein
MPEWLIAALSVLFLIHLLAFARLAIVQGEAYYWLVSCVFLALTTSFGLRLFAPEIAWGQTPIYLTLRYLAWLLAGISLPMLIRRLWKRRKARGTHTR